MRATAYIVSAAASLDPVLGVGLEGWILDGGGGAVHSAPSGLRVWLESWGADLRLTAYVRGDSLCRIITLDDLATLPDVLRQLLTALAVLGHDVPGVQWWSRDHGGRLSWHTSRQGAIAACDQAVTAACDRASKGNVWPDVDGVAYGVVAVSGWYSAEPGCP